MENAIKSVSLVFTFLILTPITLGISLFSLITVSNSETLPKQETIAHNLIKEPKSGVRVYASLPITQPSFTTEVTSADARPALLKQYMTMYNSPILVPYAEKIVETADKYSLDYRLITAIAQQESNLCRRIPPGSHNCWGWGITSINTLHFDSYEQGIEEVSRGLKRNYIDKGYIAIEDIMSKYTPSSNGSWANGVSTFLEDME